MIKAIAVLILGVGVSLSSFGLERGDVASVFTWGKYTYDVATARAKAKTEHRPIIMVQGRFSDNCQHCKEGSDALFGTIRFMSWAGNNHIPLVFGNYDEGGAYEAVKQLTGETSFPQLAIVAEDGATMWFHYVPKSSSKPYPLTGGSIQVSPGTDGFLLLLSCILDGLDNSYTKAQTIPVGDGSYTMGQYYDFSANGANTLSRIKNGYYVFDDKQDWYVINGAPSGGKGYRITLDAASFSDDADVGRILVFDGAANAKIGTEEVALFPEMKLTDLAASTEGIFVSRPGAKTYIKLYRGEVTAATTVKYKLAVAAAEGGPSESFGFVQSSVPPVYEDYSRAGAKLQIPVFRTLKDAAADVKIAVEGYQNATGRAAVEGEDFKLDTKTLHFAEGQLTNSIQVTVYTNKASAAQVTRMSKFSLTECAIAPGAQSVVYLTILDRNTPVRSQGDDVFLYTGGPDDEEERLVSLEVGMSVPGDPSTAYDDYCNYYVLTNRPSAHGSLYGFEIALVETNAACDRLTVKLYRGMPEAKNCFYENEVLAANRDGLLLLWGSDTETGLDASGSPDVVVEVSRTPYGGIYPDRLCRYDITWWRWDRPTVSFAEAGGDYPSALTNRAIQLSARAEYPADLQKSLVRRPDVAAAIQRVSWGTASVGEPAAVADVDYVSTNGVVTVDPERGGSLAVTLLSPDCFSSPTRSFAARLLPSADDLYCVAEPSNFVFRLLEDPAPAADPESNPKTVSIGAQGVGDFAVTEPLNLSFTNVEEWVRYEIPSGLTNEFFRLAVTNDLVRPAGADDDVTVTVYLNGKALAKREIATFGLDELADPANAPVLSFAGLGEPYVTVCLSRPADRSVRYESRLMFRVWRPDGAKDGGELDEADKAVPSDDTRAGAAVVQVASDGTPTNLVRTLHGFDHPEGGNGEPYAVNDTDDWFRFTNIQVHERYVFDLTAFAATNADVTLSFFHGDEESAFTNVSAKADLRVVCDTVDARDIVLRVSRPNSSERVAFVSYALRATKYIFPEIGFELPPDFTVDATNTRPGSVTLRVIRRASTVGKLTAEVQVETSGWASHVVSASGFESRVEFEDGAESVDVTIPFLTPEKVLAWVGDWTFDAKLVLTAESADMAHFYEDGEHRVHDRVTVMVHDSLKQGDPTDFDDDDPSKAREIALETASTNLNGRLNGIDTGNKGPTDTADWIRISGVPANSFLRLSFAALERLLNTEGVAISVGISQEGGVSTNLTSDLLSGGRFFDMPVLTGEPVLVGISRTKNPGEVPVSILYDLQARKVPWPEFAVAAVDPVVSNDSAFAVFTVTRTADGGTDTVSRVELAVSDTNAVKVVADTASQTVDFERGQLAAEVWVPLVMTDGFWRRGGDFTVALQKAAGSPYVRIREDKKSATVTVKDASGIPGNDYPADDEAGGAPDYTFVRKTLSATNNCGSGLSAVWLNGPDTSDWYRFKGTQIGYKYRLRVTDFAATNATGVALTMKVYAVAGNGGYGDLIESIPLVDGATFIHEATDTRGYYVEICHSGMFAADVSVRYVLTYRELSPSTVAFVATEASAAKTASEVKVAVECVLDGGGPLDEDVVVDVVPQVDDDPEAENPAVPGVHFTTDPVRLVWKAGDEPCAQDAVIRLANYSTDWTGDVTFKLVLSPVSETETVEPDKMTVTLLEREAGAPGKVGITGIGADLGKPVTSVAYEVREGDAIKLATTREGGGSGWVKGVFTWKEGTRTVGTDTIDLYEGQFVTEPAVKAFEINVPVAEGFQAKRSLTLTFALQCETGKKATILSGTPTTLKFSATDETYAAPLSDYARNDPTRVAFSSADDGWYLSTSESLDTVTPAAGKEVVMTATVTGKGTLVFDADLVDAAACDFHAEVSGTADTQLQAGENRVAVPFGTRTVSVVFGRPKTGSSSTAAARISNVRFERDADFLAYGTFVGPVTMKRGETTYPGYLTLTVSGGNRTRVSGKLQNPLGAMVFVSDEGWDGDCLTVTAGSDLVLAFTVDKSTGLVTVSGEGVTGLLMRDAWGDRPIDAKWVEVLTRCTGYHTMALKAVEGDDKKPFGHGYLGVTVAADGSIRAAGKLADGQDIVLSGMLAPDVDDVKNPPHLCLYASPASCHRGWVVLSAELAGEEAGATFFRALQNRVYAGIREWTDRAIIGGFSRSLKPVGGAYSRLEDLYARYLGKGLSVGTVDKAEIADLRAAGKNVAATLCAADESHPVDLEFTEAGTTVKVTVGGEGGSGLFTMDFARETGLFGGYFRAVYEYSADGFARKVTKSSNYRGILVPVRDPEDAPETPNEGFGHFIMPVPGGDGSTENRSYGIIINSNK